MSFRDAALILSRFCNSLLNAAADGGTLMLIQEAQQRYFSYRAILVAIVSQNFFVLVFMGYHTIIARYVATWGIAQMCLCETMKQRGGYRTIWGDCQPPLYGVS